MPEFEAAFARGSIRSWPIAEGHAILDRRLVERGSAERRSSYMPVGHPELLAEFAKLHRDDDVAVLDFARSRGLLGFPRTSGLDDLSGDPFDWIWLHSEQVRTIIKLLVLRRGKKDEDLVKAISEEVSNSYGEDTFVFEFFLLNGDSRRVAQSFTNGGEHLHLVVPDPADIGLQDAQQVSVLPNINIPSVPPEFQNMPGKYLLLADAIIQEVINRNLNCPSKIIFPDFGHYVRSYVYTNLLEVIYSHLADYASGDGVYVRCKFCHSYFRQTHGRQAFCPPATAGMESLCAVRHRKRNAAQSDRIEKPNREREAAS